MNEEADSESKPQDLLAERRAKLERLRDSGIEPFPHAFGDRTEIAVVRGAHEGLEAGAETDDRVRVAGRLTARRGMGKASFLDLRDGTGQIQVQARLDDLGESYEGLLHLDIGDIVGIDGVVFATKRGELSVRAESWALLSKSLRPPPEKFHGLEDVETRYRKRELDLIANAETRELFIKRAQTIAAVRRWFDGRGFVEVETPVLQPLYGGALARPFTTHHNALDRDLYLRIATELYLKRLHRRRHRQGLRARQGLPQRGRLAQAQPRVHDARVVRGLCRLRGHRERARDAGLRSRARRCWGRPRSSARARRSTWRRPGGA